MFYAQMVTAIGFSSIFPFLPLYVEHLGARTQIRVELLAGLLFLITDIGRCHKFQQKNRRI
jgi:DHA1 family multidrug resistance protein-like MFS transporter